LRAARCKQASLFGERTAMALLETRELTKVYNRRTVVDEVSFDVNPGEIVGMLGPNGAGKTTAFRMTIGMIHPQHGQVFFDGEDVSLLPMYQRARRGMGYLAQEPSIFQKLTVAENIQAILELRGTRRRQRRKLTQKLLGDFGLSHLARSRAYTLSGGERRRLEIARTLCTQPKLILLDEPFTGVDPIAVTEVQELVKQLKFMGIGILITDHNVAEALRITDRAYILSEGRIVTSGTPEQIVHDPIARKSYLGDRFTAAHIGLPMETPPPGQISPDEPLPEEHHEVDFSTPTVERTRKAPPGPDGA
jgi:lipopolysaccharide export system ATP-binding protein